MPVATRSTATPRRRPADRASTGRDRPAPAAKQRAAKRKAAPPRRAAQPVRAVVPVTAGVAWGLLLTGVLLASSLLTALVLIPVAVVATASGLRSAERWRGRRARAGRRPPLLLILAVAAAVIDPLCALGGSVAALVALVLSGGTVTVLVVYSVYTASARPLRTMVTVVTAALAPTVAVTTVVVARHQGSTLALLLIGATLAYDSAAFLMGNGRTPAGGPVGMAFGALTLAVLALFAAAVMDPPFSGIRPWLVFAFLAVLAPLGVRLGSLVAGAERLPALRRLDSWTLTAPFWVLAAALFLHR